MSTSTKDRFYPVKSILVSQPEPADITNSPYHKLAEKYDIRIDFRQFIKVEPVSSKDFRKQKIDILKHTAIIFTSRNAVDHFFNICKESKIEMPPKYEVFLYIRANSQLSAKIYSSKKKKSICRGKNRAGYT